MPIRPKHTAEKDFEEFTDVLHESVTEGHSDYAREYGRQASTHRRNTRRDLIRDHIVKRLRAGLADRRGVHIRDGRGTTYFSFFGRWQVQVRMLRPKLKVALNRTQLAFDIQNNADDAPPLGPMFSGTTKVYLGYETPESGSDLSVMLVCPDGRRNAWELAVEPRRDHKVVPLEPKAPLLPDDEELVRVATKKSGQEGDEQDIQSGHAGTGEGGKGPDSI